MGKKGKQEPTIREYIQAGYPCLFMRTTEPSVAEEMVKEALEDLSVQGIKLGVWKVTDGLKISDFGSGDGKVTEVAQDLRDALAYIEKADKPIVALFHNVRQFVDNYQIIQQTIDSANAARLVGSHIIFIGPHLNLPIELKNIVTFVDCPLPSQEQIAIGYKQILKAYSDDITLPKGEEELEELVKDASSAAIGLDSIGAENALALSLATTSGIDLNVIQSQKEQEVRKSDVLEFVPVKETMDDVGGFDAFKTWLQRRKKVFTEEARDYGLPYPRGMLIVGPAGCTSGSTSLSVRRAVSGGGHPYTIREAFYKFNQIPKMEFGGGRYRWRTDVKTQTLALKEKVVGYNDIQAIVNTGIKTTYTVTVESGRNVRVSLEHPFKVPQGTQDADDEDFKKLYQLCVGDKVLLRDWGRKNKRKRQIAKRRIIESLPYHPYAMDHWVDGHNYKRAAFAKLVLEAQLNDIKTERLIDICKRVPKEARKLQYLPIGASIHHKDGNTMNDAIENLEIFMEEKEHQRRRHGSAIVGRVPYRLTVAEKIVSIEKYRKEETFDIIMEDPYHNYLANDFVVHNSGKSLTAKACAAYLKLPLLRMDMGKIYRSLVGESEAAVRTALRVTEAVSPVVLWLDEIEKGMAGMAGSGDLDSGVTARVVSTLLTWRQETTYPVMLVATANNVTSLPSMVYRKGRLDEVWATDLPSLKEREEIFKIHLRKRNRDPKKFGCAALAVQSENMTGAEIEACIEDAMFTAFDNGAEVTAQNVLRSIRETIPQAVRDDVEIKAIREWVANKARLVSGTQKAKAGSNVRRIKTVKKEGS